MKVDTKGSIWESGPGGIWIISPQGTVLGHIQVPELVANLAFGDPDHKTLYIAARNSVYKIRTNVAGIPWVRSRVLTGAVSGHQPSARFKRTSAAPMIARP